MSLKVLKNQNLPLNLLKRKVFRIGTVCYNWPVSAHTSQAFSIAYCTDSEDLPLKTVTCIQKDLNTSNPVTVRVCWQRSWTQYCFAPGIGDPALARWSFDLVNEV